MEDVMAKLTTDDWCSVQDFWGTYCWLVDEGKGDEWASLWTEDGSFIGIAPEPVTGHAALRNVPIAAYADYQQGQMRHLVGNLTCEYGENRDIVKARLYNYVSVWGGAAPVSNFVMALCETTMVRSGDSWKLKENRARLLTPA
jgi:hypothetical protein